mmetsp:Transcript_59340/g.141491  ORF Transcript_59340/g.141491 Transcript_59340/m.141491 type:complete len:254 (+) Transcript_59340:454-1215(+)
MPRPWYKQVGGGRDQGSSRSPRAAAPTGPCCTSSAAGAKHPASRGDLKPGRLCANEHVGVQPAANAAGSADDARAHGHELAVHTKWGNPWQVPDPNQRSASAATIRTSARLARRRRQGSSPSGELSRWPANASWTAAADDFHPSPLGRGWPCDEQVGIDTRGEQRWRSAVDPTSAPSTGREEAQPPSSRVGTAGAAWDVLPQGHGELQASTSDDPSFVDAPFGHSANLLRWIAAASFGEPRATRTDSSEGHEA